MTKTTNYQLNQWDASDYVRRTDFNEDNAKIDAALTQAASVQKLGTWTLSAAADHLDIPLSGIDLTQFPRLHLTITGAGWTGAAGLRVNAVTSGYRTCTCDTVNDSTASLVPLSSWDACTGWAELFPFSGGVGFSFDVACILASNGTLSGSAGWGRQPNLSYSALTKISLVCKDSGDTMGAGTQVILYGMKY